MNDPTIPCPECQGRPKGGLCVVCEGRRSVLLSEAKRYVKGLRRDAGALQTEASEMLRRAKELADRVDAAAEEAERTKTLPPLARIVRQR